MADLQMTLITSDVAIATGALLVVSNDKDLLDLMNDSNQEGKALRSRYPALRILTPPQLLADAAGAIATD